MNVILRTAIPLLVAVSLICLSGVRGTMFGPPGEDESGQDRQAPSAGQAEPEADHAPRRAFVRDLPTTDEYVRLLAKPESLALHAGLVTLAPGEDCGWHSTEHYEEMIVCLEGEGELASRGMRRTPLHVGQYGYNPPHTRHNVFNTGEKKMRYIYIVAPALPKDPD